MRQVREEITKERYDHLMSMERTDRTAEIKKDIPIEWELGYGWYGYFMAESNGKYYIVHDLGSTCD